MNPFSAEVTGKLGKLSEQLSGLSEEQAQELLASGYFPALREAKVRGTLLGIDQFRQFVSGQYDLVQIKRTLDCSFLFNPEEFLAEGWDVVEQDERALALAQMDFAQVQFVTCLKEKETSIEGKGKLRRLKEEQLSLIRHGGNQFLALWQDYQKNGADSVLEWLRKTKGITYLDFFGLILRSPRGHWYVLCLYWLGGSWHWRCYGLDEGWRDRDFSVVSPAS